jgi:hypothetical protein
MSNAIPPIMVQIAADVSQLKAGLAQAQSSIKGMDSTVATANTGMQSMLGTAKKMASTLGVAFAATQIVQFGKDTIMAASSMAESVSKVNVVFGDSAAGVLAFGETSAKALGIGSQKALEAAGTYGNLFQALGVGRPAATEMSTSLVQLAADLASFNNTSIDDALNALRSGLSGETEPLKRFGVALNDVTLKNKAMAMGFGQIKGVMDPAIKAQVTYALVMEQTSLAQGDYARTADGTANTMKSLAAEFENAKVAIGEILMPAFKAILAVLKLLVPVITAITKYFKDNADAIKMLAILVAAGTTAFLVYKGVMIATGIVTAVYTAIVKAQAAGFTIAQLAAFNLKVAIFLLNNAMRANPIGLIVTALALLAAGFVYAWKKSETFRGIVIKGVQMILDGFSKLVSGIGKFAGLISKVPGMGWAKGIADGAQNAADKIAITSKNLSDLKSNFKGMGNISMTASTAGVTGGATTTTTTTTTTTSDAAKKAREKYLKDVADVNKKYKGLQDKFAEIQKDAADKTKKAEEERSKNTLRAYVDYANTRIKLQNEYDAEISEASLVKDQEQIAARKENTKELKSIEEEFNKKRKELEADLQEKLADIRDKAAQKSADLLVKASDKQASIIQKSVDRLRSAFASKTGFSLSEAFGAGKSTEALLSDLRTKLNAAKNLAENAAFLQANGFSQTFIEQVVSAGPEVGNSLAEAILNSSPETMKELQATFTDMESTSNYGLDALAKTMNSGAKLATAELMKEFNEVGADLAQSLAVVDAEMQTSLAKAISNFDEASAEAQFKRDARIADSLETLQTALAEASTKYDKAIEQAQKILNEGLKESEKTLADALISIQDDYNDAITAIAASTKDKLLDLQKEIKTTLDLMTKLKMDTSGIKGLSGSVASGVGSSAAEYAAGMTTSYLSSIKTTMTAVNTYMRLIASTRDAARKADYETKLAAIMKNVESYVADIARLNPGKDVNAILAAAGITLPNGTPAPDPDPFATTTPTTKPTTTVNTNSIAGINAASGFTLTQNITYPTASAEDISAKTLAAIKFGTSGGYSFTESQGVR